MSSTNKNTQSQLQPEGAPKTNANNANKGEGGMPSWLATTLQVIVGLIVIFILYLITLAILNVDAILAKDKDKLVLKQRSKTTILDGYLGPSMLKDINVNGINPWATNFSRLSKSVNEKGGISFTFQFWIKIDQANDAYFKDLILLLKGVNTKYIVGYYAKPDDSSSTSNSLNKVYELPPDYYVACPMIAFGDSYRDLKVRFNSNKDIYNEIRITSMPGKNLLSLVPLNWTMFTFVFEDSYSVMKGSSNGIKLIFYVNDIEYYRSSVTDFEGDFYKWNDGNLYLLPNVSTQNEFMRMGNINYYNYAVSAEDVTKTFSYGGPKHLAINVQKPKDAYPGFVGALNKIDVYNF